MLRALFSILTSETTNTTNTHFLDVAKFFISAMELFKLAMSRYSGCSLISFDDMCNDDDDDDDDACVVCVLLDFANAPLPSCCTVIKAINARIG